MMLNSVLRREINKQRFALPFCLQYVVGNKRTFSGNASPTEAPKSEPREPQKPEQTSRAVEDNPFLWKYSEKIEKAKKEAALSPKGREDTVSSEHVRVKQGLERLEEAMDPKSKQQQPQPVRSVSQEQPSEGGIKGKRLEDVVRVDLFKKHPTEEISRIWSSYHAKKDDCIYAVIPSSSYNLLYETATQYPLFIYPLPRVDKTSLGEEEGRRLPNYEFIFGQFTGHSFYLTPLLVYQTHKENSPPCLVVNHFPELEQENKIVLMSGEFDKNVVNLLEAQCLANQIKLYYGGEDMRKRLLLHTFNREPQNFDYADLIKEFEESLVLKPS